jgi:hypothetical protein
MLRSEIGWQEDAIALQGQYGGSMVEAFGSDLSSKDYYAVASGAIGSGAARVKMMEAQNRVAFREVWRNYNGTDPSPADYDYVTKNYVAPTEYAHRMAAKESAKEQITSVNDLLSRTMGKTVTLGELENLAMGGKDSGTLKAMIDQATRLDTYRWTWKQYHNQQEPTPDDYAQFAGYASVAELQWEIVTNEKIKEYDEAIQDVWQKAYGETMSAEDMHTMLGETEGYGDLQGKWTKAKEMVADEENAQRGAHYAEKTRVAYTQAEQGGFKEGMAGLADLG